MSATGPGFAAEDLSLFERIQRVFYAPRTAFAAVRGQESAHDWLLPALLVCAVGIGAHNLTLDVGAPAVQEQLESLDEAERQQAEAFQEHGWMVIPVGLFFSLVVVGGVLLMLARSVFQAEVNYRQMLVVKAYAMLVVAVEWAVRAVLVLATGDIGAHLGLGLFLSEEAAATFCGRILTALNPFDLWQNWDNGRRVERAGRRTRAQGDPHTWASMAILASRRSRHRDHQPKRASSSSRNKRILCLGPVLSVFTRDCACLNMESTRSPRQRSRWLPFWAELGRVIYAYELERKRAHRRI